MYSGIYISADLSVMKAQTSSQARTCAKGRCIAKCLFEEKHAD